MEQEHYWSISDAKAKLSEILRLSEEQGPQRIGTRKRYIIVPEEQWEKCRQQPLPMGQWLVENMPKFGELALPPRADRANPFDALADE